MKFLISAIAGVLATASPIMAQDQPSNDNSDFVVSRDPCPGTLDGFLKIAWGTSVVDVRKAMKDQAGFTDATPQGLPNDLIYTGGKFANLEVKQLQLHFFHGQFSGASVTLKPTADDAQTLTNLRDALTQKYGNWFGLPDSPVWKFQDSNTIGLDKMGGLLVISYSDTELSNSERSEASTGINPSGL